MSETSRRVSSDSGVFRVRTIAILLFVGIFSFGAFFTIAGFSDSLRSLNNGRSHAASKSPNGFAGIYRLLSERGLDPELMREDSTWEDDDTLTIHTLPHPYVKKQVEDVNTYAPALIVLPKWRTAPDRREHGRTIRYGIFDPDNIAEVVEKFDDELKIFQTEDKDKADTIVPSNSEAFSKTVAKSFASFGVEEISDSKYERLQTFTSDVFEPILTSGEGTVFGKMKDKNIYLLADPDLFNNAGIKKFENAKLAMSVIDYASHDYEYDYARTVYFDLIAHGLGTKQNMIKIMLTPPFLAATLCLFALGGLIGWRAFTRFGKPEIELREYALGKQALADNSAALIKMAGREPAMARRYAELIKQRVARSVNAPKTLTDADLLETLDRMGKRGDVTETLSSLSSKARIVDDNFELMKNAQGLYNWKQEITHGRD